MTDRSVRNLAHLEGTASTARTLNLLNVWRKHATEPDYLASPFFHSSVLNRSIILKHRIRRHESELFPDYRVTGTKVIIPIDNEDLKLGARYFFIGQIGYDDVLKEVAPHLDGVDAHDHELLQILDNLPSLDPFLTREKLRKSGYLPARCCFELTDADLARMFAFVRGEIQPLIGISFNGVDAVLDSKTIKLANMILADSGDADLEPLRLTMGMDKSEFEEGIFCWKGFIYYKWTLNDLLPQIRPVLREITSILPSGTMGDEEKAYILSARRTLEQATGRSCDTVRKTLKVYDDAFAALTRNGQPKAFREFLLRAPGLFCELGERLGALQHIVSFWRFRFPARARARIGAEELADTLLDFETSLNFSEFDSTIAA